MEPFIFQVREEPFINNRNYFLRNMSHLSKQLSHIGSSGLHKDVLVLVYLGVIGQAAHTRIHLLLLLPQIESALKHLLHLCNLEVSARLLPLNDGRYVANDHAEGCLFVGVLVIRVQ